MRATEQTYRNVAKHCSAYASANCNRSTNRIGDTEVSCTTCRHFTTDKYCSLDLFDPIVENHKF